MQEPCSNEMRMREMHDAIIIDRDMNRCTSLVCKLASSVYTETIPGCIFPRERGYILSLKYSYSKGGTTKKQVDWKYMGEQGRLLGFNNKGRSD